MECRIQIDRYYRVNEGGVRTDTQYYARCLTHETRSIHDFRNSGEAWTYFRCDPTEQRFLFFEAKPVHGIPPFTGDLTELSYQIASMYEHQMLTGEGVPLKVVEIKIDEHGHLHMLPVNIDVRGGKNFDSDDYSYPRISAFRVIDGEELTSVTLRIDGRV
jgi:hypothetical protein